MKFKKIIIFTLGLTALIVICVTGIFFYFYTHPSAVVSLIERSIQRYTSVSLTMDRFSYALDPFRIQAEGIRIRPTGGSSGFSLQIPEMTAKLLLTGGFGRKSLVVEHVELSEFSAAYDLAQFRLGPKLPSSETFIGSLLRRAVAIFLFRNIRIDAVNLTNGHLIAQLNGPVFTAENISAHRSADRRIEIVSAARLRWPSKAYDMDIPNLTLSTHDRVSLSDPAIRAKISARKMVFRGPETTVNDIGIDVDGNFYFAIPRVDIPHLSITISEGFRLNGALDVNSGDPKKPAIFTIQKAVFLPETLLELAPDRLRQNLTPLEVNGEVSASGLIKLFKTENTFALDYALNLHLEENSFTYRDPKREIRGRTTGMVEVRGSATDVIVTADLVLKDSKYKDPRLQVVISRAEFALTGNYPDFQIKKASGAISELILPQGDKDVSLKDIQLQVMGGTAGIDDNTLRLPRVRAELPTLGILEGMIEVNGDEIHAHLDKQDVRMLAFLKELKVIPSGWEVGGQQSLSVDATLKSANRLSFDSRIYLSQFTIQDPTALMMGDDLSADIQVKGTWNIQDPSLAGYVSVNFTNGEILYDLFYVNLSKNHLITTAEMAYNPSAGRIDITDYKLALKDTFSLGSSGHLTVGPNRQAHLKFHVPLSPLAPLFQLLLVEPLQADKPFIADLRVNGKVAADLELFNTGKGWTLKGYCRWRDGRLEYKEKNIAVERINLNYPLWYHSNSFQGPVDPLAGAVSIGSIQFPYMPEQPLQLTLRAIPNGLTVPSETRIDVDGGTVLIGPVFVKGLFSSTRFVKTDLSVMETDITPALTSIWSNAASGSLKGRLDPVLVRGNRIAGNGAISVEAFNGNLTLTDIFVERLLSASPLIGFNTEFDGLRLGQLTAGTKFGNIEGLLRGHLNNLQISYGQPQQFDLLVETVKKQNVKREISIQAIENIAQIGSGGGSPVRLSGIFTSLFETLRYDKIGIRASLENDIFKINGTIREDGKEYLMKGGAISGVNIINQNPNNRISFKDMVKRIKRVTEGGTPVIN